MQIAGHSSTAPYSFHTSPRSPGTRPHNTGPDCTSSGYFSISVDNSASTRCGPPSFSQATAPCPGSLLSNRMLDAMSPRKTPIESEENKGPSTHKSPLNPVTSLEPKVGNCHTISAERFAELLGSCQHDVMLLDVRPYAHFAKRNIKGSLNLCIPTTLLKRPSFDTQKLENTFTDESDRRNFAKWRQCRYIAVYDAATSDIKDAVPLANVLKKFTTEGWNGEGLILLGGFNAFSDRFPGFIQQQSPLPKKPTSMHINLPSGAPISGGCALPDASRPAIPFFGNIRQHMDLLGGVGQIPLQLPTGLTESKRKLLPAWLRKVSDPADKGLNVSEKFLDLEKRELERMKQALSYNKSADASRFKVAGIEKGTKNRYNDVYPFDHTRVKLQDVPPGGCDYVNANYMKAEYSDKCYIATQAPVPDTFNDFWRVIWEQDIRLIVSLTAEVERGQVKCHPYWESGSYGPFQIHNFAQKYIYMDDPGLEQVDRPKTPVADSNEGSENSCIIMRHFSLSHTAHPFQPLREVTQLQYPYWPDFGTTSQPTHLLKLIAQCDKVRNATANRSRPMVAQPILVHCSAGCGRTGSFCTVDSVLGMLKHPLEGTAHRKHVATDAPAHELWTHNENLDLIAKAVADFRTQRPSMVQNLSQFVLCYESVLEWSVSNLASGGSI